MFNALFEEIEKWMRQLLSGMVTSNLTNMFTDVNQKTGEIASQVGQTPQGWNGSIFSMIRSLSNSVIIPIAGMIITFILCYELISMVTSANNMHDVDTFMFFKYFFKMWVAVWIVSHTFDMVMAIFDVGQHVVNSAAGVIGGSTAIDISSLVGQMSTTMQTMEMGELVLSSVAAIPFATMSNREWGQIGNNYLCGLLALAFQGFFIMVCVAIYAVLVSTMQISDNMHSALFGIAAYTVMLCFALLKTGSLSKSVFNAH